MKIHGNYDSQNLVKQILKSQFRTMSLVGQSHLGKFSFLESELASHLCSDDVLISGSSIEDARTACDFAESKPLFSPFRAIVIDDAQFLSDNAVDSYLKLCEDTPNTCRIIFITCDDGFLPESMRSRIQYMVTWSRLSNDDFDEFVKYVSPVIDKTSFDLCSRIPGFYLLFKNNNSYGELINQILNTNTLSSVPDLVKKIKSGHSIERDALAFIIGKCARVVSDIGLSVNLLRFSSNLIKFPSINAEVHWKSVFTIFSL